MSKAHYFAATLALFASAVASGSALAATGNCKYARIAEWPVRLVNGDMIVDGTINGKAVGIMLDTGSERSLILRSSATRLGLDMQPVPDLKIVGVGGESKVDAAHVDEFSMAEATRKDWWVIVAGDIDFGRNVDFILGEDFFRFVDVEFDLAHNTVRLFQPKDCENAPLAYWAPEGAGQVGIDKVDEGRPQILLGVQINGVAMKALLDTGAATSVINRRDADRAGVTPATPGVIAIASGRGVGKNTIDSWIAPFSSFVIGDERIRDTTIRFAELSGDAAPADAAGRAGRPGDGPPAMLLGTDFLRAHRVLVAHSQRRIYFTYIGGPVFSIDTPFETPAGSAQAPAKGALAK